MLPEGASLQQRLEGAFATLVLAKDRAEPIDQSAQGKTFRLVARPYSVYGGVAGVLLQYEQGKSAVSLIETMNAAAIDLEEFAPPQVEGEEGEEGLYRQWVESLMYFYVRGDIVVMIQSMALRALSLEKHFTWLLREAENDTGASVVLANVPPADISELIHKSHVKAVEISGDFVSTQETNPDNALEISVGGSFVDAVAAVADSVTQVVGQQLNLADGADGNMKAKISLTFKNKTNPKAQQLLDSLAIVFRNVDQAEAEIELLNGQKLKGSQLKLQKQKRIVAKDGVLSEDNAFVQMSLWLKQLVEEGSLTL